jgi:hypothetical protein
MFKLNNCEKIIKTPGFYPSRQQVVESLTRMINPLSAIEYTAGYGLMYLTFVFSGPKGKERSPPEGTYRTEPNSHVKLAKKIRR